MEVRVHRGHGLTDATAGAHPPHRSHWWILPLGVLVLAVILPLTTFVVGSWLAGWQLQPVLSGSMSPTYGIGSLLVVESIDASDVRPGMPVMFVDPANPERLVTHRVVKALPGDEIAFETRGDANSIADPFPVTARAIRGRAMWDVPYLGYVFDWLAWPRGFLLLVVLPAIALVTTESRALRRVRIGGTPASNVA